MHTVSNPGSIWVHYMNDTDWSKTSYVTIHTCETAEEIITTHETMIQSEPVFKKHMIFFMKYNIYPMWEDESNKDGGCFVFYLANATMYEKWKTVLYSVIGNTISTSNEFMDDITGVVISPRRHYYVVQLWMKTKTHSSTCISKSILDPAYPEITFKLF